MASGDPLAVAFVEVRPDVDEFRSNADQELRASLDDSALNVQGTVDLDTRQAQAELDALAEQASVVAGLGGTQLQFEGLEDASAQIDQLTESTASFGDTVGTGATALSALIARQEQLARSSGDVRANLRAEQQELRQTVEEENRLARVRAGRAVGVAGLRFAGIGLGAGFALFAATRAVRELGEGLAVTGDEASTTEGKLRNLGSAVLAGDIVGAFRALADNTHTYSRAQLELINQTPQLVEALEELGEAANIARSASEVLAGLSQPPQFLQTALAREQAQGDVSGQIRVLEEQLAFFKEAEETARQIATSVEQRNTILEPIFEAERRIREQLERLMAGEVGGGARRPAARTRGGADDLDLVGDMEKELDDLERERRRLEEVIPSGESEGRELERLRGELGEVNRSIETEAKRLTAEQNRHAEEMREDVLVAGGVNFSADFEALAIAGTDASELQALQKERAELERVISQKEVEAEQLERNKDRLRDVNEQIEDARAEIRAEQQRHAEELRSQSLQRTRIATLEAETSGGGESAIIAGLEAEREEIQRQLDLKGISADEREALLGQLKSINSRIESFAEAAAAEAEQHARDVQDAQDRADQAFLDALDDRQRRANRNRIRIEASAQLTDDIRLSEDLQRIFREQIAAARKTINDQRLRDQTIADLMDQLTSEEQNEAALRREQRRTAIERREESLDLDIEIAAAQDNERKEIRAHEAKIRFLTERIRHTREGTNQRKRLRLEIAQERAEIKRLQEELKEEAKEDEGASFDQLAASFLEELQGFSATFGSNLLPPGGGASFPGMQPPTPADTFRRPDVPTPPISVFDIPDPFEAGRGSGRSQAEAAAQLREDRGAPVSQGQGNELIDLTKATNRLLREIKAGLGHTEASTSRRLARNTVETSQD